VSHMYDDMPTTVPVILVLQVRVTVHGINHEILVLVATASDKHGRPSKPNHLYVHHAKVDTFL